MSSKSNSNGRADSNIHRAPSILFTSAARKRRRKTWRAYFGIAYVFQWDGSLPVYIRREPNGIGLSAHADDFRCNGVLLWPNEVSCCWSARSCRNMRFLATSDGIVWYVWRKDEHTRSSKRFCDFLYRLRSTNLRHTTRAPYLSIAINIVPSANSIARRKLDSVPDALEVRSQFVRKTCLAHVSWVRSEEWRWTSSDTTTNAINQAQSIRRW